MVKSSNLAFVFVLVSLLFSCTTTKSFVEKRYLSRKPQINSLALFVNDHHYAESIQEYLEEELDIIEVYIIDEDEDESDKTSIKSSTLLNIKIEPQGDSPFWKYVGLGIIPTSQKNNLKIEAELVKDKKRVANWSFSLESKSYFGIWFLPFIHKYDSRNADSLNLIVNNIISDLVDSKVL